MSHELNALSKIAVFLDRDGVINEEVDLLYRIDQLRLLPGAVEAIRKLNEHGLKVIVVTNQPVVARGLCTERDIEKIHKKLQRMLQEEGARLDAIYWCPHHENADLPQYRKACPDRKPGIGLFLKAAEQFELDLRRSFALGDRTVDIQAGKNAGCRTILVKTGYGGRDGKYEVSPDYICEDLKEAVELILKDLMGMGSKLMADSS